MKCFLGCSFFLLPLLLSALEPAQREEIKTLIRDKKWTDARAQLAPLIAAEPTNAELQFFLGQSYLYAHEPEGAVSALEKATALDPKSSRYLRHLGDAYGLTAQKAGIFSKMGWAKKCKVAYDQAVELDPKDIDARWSIMEFCRQAPSFLGGGMDQAYAQAAEIQKLDLMRGRGAFSLLYVAEKKYNEAFALYDEVLKEKPDDYETLLQIGRLAGSSGEHLDQGLAALQRCLTLPPPRYQPNLSRVHWRIGIVLEKKRDPAGARAAYEAALAIDPQFKPVIEALANLK